MSSNTDIIALLSSDADKAVDQIIEDSKRLHIVVNGTGTEQAVAEDGSLLPSVRKALIDNLYFKTPPLPWRNGGSVNEFNQLYSFTDVSGNTTWWYAPGATVSNPVVMRDSPINDGKFKVFLDKTNIADIYAPLNSPNFVGNPRVPTPAPGDNSQTVPTTGWVQSEMQDLEDQIIASMKGDFENITVRNDAVLKDTYISGEFIVTSDKLSAASAEATFRRIRVVGTADNTEIAFEQNTPPPAGASTKTNIKPYTMSTGILTIDQLKGKSAQIGDVAVATDSLNVDGYMRGDYLHLEGNNRNSTTRPQLIVDGIAEINTLRVTGTIEGVKADVDGLDIHPRSVIIDEGLTVGKDTSLTGKLTVGGTTKVNNLEVTGTLSGVAISVDGKDIKPRSVNTGNLVATGNVQISGTTTATGKITTQDLEVLGTLTANLDLSGSDLSVDNINVAETATIKDLVVTGKTTGVKGDVDGTLIKPSSVQATGLVSAGSLSTNANASIGGNLTVTGEFRPASMETGAVEADSLVVNGNISQTTGTTSVVNLVVTGTTTGVTADVNGDDILPRSVTTTAGVKVGTTLDVTGKTTLGDVDFTGVVTGLELDLSQKNVTVKSIAAVDPSAFGDVTTDNLTNSEKIITQDIQVLGDILDAAGNPVNTFDVTGKDILPNSVQSATFIRGKTLDISDGSTLRGPVEFRNGLTVTLGDIMSPQGKATFNDVQVNGALTDANGNVIGSVESIKGKDIEPRSVVATVSVQAPRLQSTGDILGQSATITNNVSAGTLGVSGLTNLAETRVNAKLTGQSTEFETLLLKRVAGQDTPRLVVQGDSDLQGDLNVSGTITGTVDLTAQDINMKSLGLSGDLTAGNITSRGTVTGVNGVFGGGSTAPGAIGLQSLTNAKIATNLDVGGDLRVTGTISGDLNLAGKDVSMSKMTATTVVGTDATFTNLTVTGTLNAPDSPLNITDLTTDNLVSKKMSILPKSETVGVATYAPDGSTNVYNVNVTADTEIQAPVGLLFGGKAESCFIYLTQDGTGHAVTFSGDYFVHGAKVVNPAPDALTICNLVYRGIGNVIDVFITERT
ncbi:tail fiber protein [Cronobacter phage CR3]|uniref:Putative tail fiber protein 2 n=1 Tax=Cronobacter phage CR3 TaxID=1162295 RepID=I1TR75_9CAUD|nr:tail fiber protein [Cronobacter phage CR3]AFH21198.1 putative tail fiber protein 2 [Cronobacter phage CR3]